MSQNFLDNLSPEQRAAAANIDGATLIIAGAGSGKTRTLTYRIANMLDQGIDPQEILVLTFTNKAATEMKERIAQVVEPGALRGLWMGTFHSVFMRILRQEAKLIGYPDNFTIYDTTDSRNLVKAIIKELELADDKYKPADVFNRISRAKNAMVSPIAYSENSAARTEDQQSKRPLIYQIYARYAKRCKENGAMDFDDLLYQMNVLLRHHPEVQKKYAQRFKYIMVDEYQDTNYSQYLIVKMLASTHGNVCVVGDDSQSIYSFRGAQIQNILKFTQDFPNANTYKLEQNYRSTKNIVDASNSLIKHNAGKLNKNLYSKNSDGELIRVMECYSDRDEASKVVRDIYTKIYVQKCSPGDIAILYRTNQQSRELEEQLLKKGIAYRIYKGAAFYSRKEIKDMLCYLRLAVNPSDDESFKRIINVPARGIGGVSLQKIEQMAVSRGVSMTQVVRECSASEIGISGKAAVGLSAFVEAFNSFAEMASVSDAYEFALDVANKSGMLAFYQASRSIEDRSKLDNIEELINSIKSFSRSDIEDGEIDFGGDNEQHRVSIYDWLSEVSLISDTDISQEDDTPRVGLMTIHSSKGLEFKYVYIVGVEEGMIPSIRSDVMVDELEEERRLFYVAITRAKSEVMFSYAQRRLKWGSMNNCEVSRFVEDIDQRHLEYLFLDGGDSGVGGGSGGSRGGRGVVKSDFLRVGSNLRRVESSYDCASEVSSVCDLRVGQRVVHERFGVGTIEGLEQLSSDIKVSVVFDVVGSKVLLSRFAKLRLL